MTIQSIGSAPPRTPDRVLAGPDSVALQPAARAPAATLETSAAVQHVAPIPTLEQVHQAVANINKSLQSLSQDVEFSVDHDSNRTIVKVIDQHTKEVLRQIPTPEALQIAKSLDSGKGMLISQEA